jgi:REP element-mobilizing transposase RayT
MQTWGGARLGAGRKPAGKRAGVPHRSREPFERLPVHVTFRMAQNVYNLRSQRSFNALKMAFRGAADRFGVRIVHFSVQGNHMHVIVEADDRPSLYRAMKGLSVRIARRMNTMMGRKGRVLGDRYHTHVLRTKREVRNAVVYVRENHRKHGMAMPRALSIDPFCSWARSIDLPMALFDTS